MKNKTILRLLAAKRLFSSSKNLKRFFIATAVLAGGATMCHELLQKKDSISVDNIFNEYFKIEVQYHDSAYNEQIISRLTSLTKELYIPSPLIFNKHLQSIYNIGDSRSERLDDYERELVRMPDGGQFSLDWAHEINQQAEYSDKNLEQTPKVMFVVHGLTGGSNMNYIKSLLITARRQGYKCVAFNSRGINTEMTSPYPFNGADLSELDTALRMVKERYPNAQLFAVGTSFGANMLLRWAASQGENCFLSGLVGLATPFNIRHCLSEMGFLYEQFFVNRYKANVIVPHLEMLKQLESTHAVNLRDVLWARTLRQFHESITIKIFNYSTIEEYFQFSDLTAEQLRQVRVPSLLLFSRDDPIVTSACVPRDILLQNDAFILASTAFGAHVCWFEGVWPPKRWYPKPVIQYFDILFDLNKKEFPQVLELGTQPQINLALNSDRILDESHAMC